MKRFFSLLSLIFFLSFTGLSQLEQGYIKYEVSATSDNPDNEMTVSMMEGSTMEIYFGDGNTRLNTSMFMVEMTYIYSSESDSILMLMDVMGMQYAIPTVEDSVTNNNEDTTSLELKYDKSKTKKILGYKCKKAYTVDEEGTTNIYWYTDKIKTFELSDMNFNSQVPGVILASETISDEITIRYEATVIETKAPAPSVFEFVIPSGFIKMTWAEFKNM